MRRPMAKKVFAATMAAAMTMSAAACGNSAAPAPAPAPEASTETKEEVAPVVEEEEVSPYTIIKDANGNTVDLGGIEIIIRDWYTGEPGEPQNDYQEAVLAYHEWLQETYNFTLTQKQMSDWGSVPGDFVDYVTTGGDDNNYLFILRPDPSVTSAIGNGLMYDWNKLEGAIDLDNDPMFKNNFHKAYTYGDATYVCYPGINEPRTGLWFNKRILEEKNVDWDKFYDMQADGTWTWDAWLEVLDQVQEDKDSDGQIDVYGFCVNGGDLTKAVLYSNGGCYIDKVDGKYEFALDRPESMEALQFTVDLFANYNWQAPADAQWDAYKAAFLNGEAAFCVEGEYYANGNNSFDAMEDEVGFVMFPKGRSDKAKLVNVWDNNLHVIPSCYDDETAWKIAFAFDQWVQAPAGYEDVNSCADSARSFGLLDGRSITETIPMMQSDEYGMVEYYSAVPGVNLGPDFAWGFGSWSTPSESVEALRPTWQGYIDDINNK